MSFLHCQQKQMLVGMTATCNNNYWFNKLETKHVTIILSCGLYIHFNGFSADSH